VIVGGAAGMVGAVVLAGRAALRSGVGLVHCIVDERYRSAVHAALPEALVSGWSVDTVRGALDAPFRDADAIVIGPGLGQSEGAVALVSDVCATDRPLLLDADALRLLRSSWQPRAAPTLLTPHPGEALVLLGGVSRARWATTFDVDRQRDVVTPTLAEQYSATVLLKGVPTVVADQDAITMVPRGTAALATGGSGDILSGIAGTLLAHGLSSGAAASCAAWVHGVAAERATAVVGGVRGTTLADVLAELPRSWPRATESLPDGLLAVLPAAPSA
jgi:ADP-dependent NAD(P)H-hydrate dehydratase / NAD(P)H-hydrate epimerase